MLIGNTKKPTSSTAGPFTSPRGLGGAVLDSFCVPRGHVDKASSIFKTEDQTVLDKLTFTVWTLGWEACLNRICNEKHLGQYGREVYTIYTFSR